MPATPKYAIPYPNGASPNNVPADMQALAEAVEDNMVGYLQGVRAARPAAGVTGRLYWASDEALVYYDDGAAWNLLLPDAFPKGLLGAPGVKTVQQLAIGAAYTDIVSLTTDIEVVGAGRWQEVAAKVPLGPATNASQIVMVAIREGAAVIDSFEHFIPAGGELWETLEVSTVTQLAEGAHTLKVSAKTAVGTMTCRASGTLRGLIWAKDIGLG